PNLVAMFLQGDMSLGGGGKTLPGGELALGDTLLPLVAGEICLDYLFAVKPVLDLRAVDHDATLVPLARWLGSVFGGRVQIVQGAGRRGVSWFEVIARVVEHLVFGTGVPGGLIGFDDAVDDPAVAPFGDLPF